MTNFYCKECGLAIATNLVHMRETPNNSEAKDGEAAVPAGNFVESTGEYPPENVGDYLLNLTDAMNTKEHDDESRLYGCCEPDGSGGLNIVCSNGHEVGTKQSDCWQLHQMILSKSLVRREEH